MPDEAVCIRCGQPIDLMEQDWEQVGSEGFAHNVCDHVHFRGDEPHSHDPYIHPWGAHRPTWTCPTCGRVCFSQEELKAHALLLIDGAEIGTWHEQFDGKASG